MAACADTQPTDLSPNYSKGAPAGKGDCNVQQLRDVQKGRITPGSCNSNDALGRRTQYYAAQTAPAGHMVSAVLTSEFRPILGIKQNTDDPTTGIVWGAFGWTDGNATLNFIGSTPGETQQLYVTNFDADTHGSFTLTSSIKPISFTCGSPTIYQAPVSFNATINSDQACHGTIQFSPFPDAIGKPLWFQPYYGKMQGRYEVALGGLSPAFNAVLTIFRNGVYVPSLQSVGPLPADGVRRVIVDAPTLASYTIEVSTSGAGTANLSQPPAGSYTLSITPVN